MERIDFSRELPDMELKDMIAREMARCKETEKLSLNQRMQLAQRVFNSLRKLDILQELLEDDEITEILVNGPQNIFYEKRGIFYRYAQNFASEEKLQDVIQQIVSKHNRVVNLISPIVDTRLEDGSRVNIVLAPIAIDGSAISIRKFGKYSLGMEDLVTGGMLTKDAAEFLKNLVSIPM